jgi:acetylornithine/succinyldiaminopimelate/putrescine aminotransferase
LRPLREIQELTQREIFLRHVAQTSPLPMALEITRAEGTFLYDKEGRKYIDLIGGISVANTGHRHPKVLAAIQRQLDAYLHVMVYGEFVQAPQVQYARMLAEHLPAGLNSIYFTNSGAEAVEGAMKLAKKATGRTKIIAFNNSYHGSTQGALSILGSEYWRNAFRPLLPGIHHHDYNSEAAIDDIDDETACVIVETVQAEAGIVVPEPGWIKALRGRCTEKNTLFILDEIQAGFARTGRLWGFQHFDITPDVLLLGKALGGGMPLGAFIADRQLMMTIADNPVLGHITTFGGHPVCCAAGMASLQALLEEDLVAGVSGKAEQFRKQLMHPKIQAVRSFGLWIAVVFDSFETNKKVIDHCTDNGVLTDWFLFAPNCLRISPPLTIDESFISQACEIIVEACEMR